MVEITKAKGEFLEIVAYQDELPGVFLDNLGNLQVQLLLITRLQKSNGAYGHLGSSTLKKLFDGTPKNFSPRLIDVDFHPQEAAIVAKSTGYSFIALSSYAENSSLVYSDDVLKIFSQSEKVIIMRTNQQNFDKYAQQSPWLERKIIAEVSQKPVLIKRSLLIRVME